MQLPSHLRQSRHGVWSYRLVLPEVLAAAVGQKEIRKSLGTRCPTTAKCLAYALSGRILPIVRKVKRTMTIDPNSIDPKSVRELIVKGLEIDRSTGSLKAEYIETSSDPEIAKQEFQALWAMTQSSPPAASTIALQTSALQRPTCGRPCSVEQAAADFMQTKQRLAESSKRAYGYRLQLLVSFLKDPKRLLNDITEEECVDIFEEYQNRAPHDTQRSPGKTGKGVISASTINDTLILWQSFFKWAISTKRYAGSNPMGALSPPSESNEETGARAFEQHELQAIFQPQNFIGMKQPHQYWGPLFGLFTGARSNEIAQLRLMDIIEVDGVMCMNIVHAPANGVMTKNPASVRKIPLHPTLLELGFDEYLDDLKKLGATRVFPELPQDKKTGKREKYLSRDFNEGLLKSLKLWQPRTVVFHSFRDTAISKLAKARINFGHIKDFTGHTRKGTAEEHYINRYSPQEQLEHIIQS